MRNSASFDTPSSIFFFSHPLPTVTAIPLYFVVLFPRRYAVAKLDETRYRIERTITASSRVGARLLTRLYVAERLNCTAQRELTPAKTASLRDAPRGGAAKNNRQSDANCAKKGCRASPISLERGYDTAKNFTASENCDNGTTPNFKTKKIFL